MTGYAQEEELTITSGHFFRDHPTIVIMLWAFVPIVGISALAGFMRAFCRQLFRWNSPVWMRSGFCSQACCTPR